MKRNISIYLFVACMLLTGIIVFSWKTGSQPVSPTDISSGKHSSSEAQHSISDSDEQTASNPNAQIQIAGSDGLGEHDVELDNPSEATAASGSTLPKTPDRAIASMQLVEDAEVLLSEVRLEGDVLVQEKLIQADFKYEHLKVIERWRVAANGEPSTLLQQSVMVADHVVVKLKVEEASAFFEQLENDHGYTKMRKLSLPNAYLVALNSTDLNALPQALEVLASLPESVEFAEPDYIGGISVYPNDQSFHQEQWNLNSFHANSNGYISTDIDAVEAWDFNTGDASVVVGVIDSGIDYNHVDLSGNIWTNPGEIAGNAIDDDGNGYVDDVHGYDFVNTDGDPMDDQGHGTHVAGILGAVGNNSTGIAGVAWDVSMVAIKFIDANGNGTASDAADAIQYATDIGVKLTNNSWKLSGGHSQIVENAIQAADTAGILFVTSAGNDGLDIDLNPAYPASYTLDNIITVAATDRFNNLAVFASGGSSNFGQTAVDLAAPGTDIYSTLLGDTYGENSGTSMAAPHVAGAAVILWAADPTLTASEVKDSILSNVATAPSLEGESLVGKCVSGGRLSLFGALDDVLQSPFNGPHTIPGTIQLEDYDMGGSGIAFYDRSSTNEGGAYRTGPDDAVDIQAIAGGFKVSHILSSEWMEYTVDSIVGGYYDITLRCSSDREQSAIGYVKVLVDGFEVTTFRPVPTGSLDTFQDVVIQAIELPAATNAVLKLQISGYGFDLDWIQFVENSDSDGDGIPSSYEVANGLNPTDPTDIHLDPDRDGLSAWVEYTNGETDAAPRYQIVDLGAPPEDPVYGYPSYYIPMAINDNNVVVGEIGKSGSFKLSFPINLNTLGFVWTESTGLSFVPHPDDPDAGVSIRDINNAGKMAGFYVGRIWDNDEDVWRSRAYPAIWEADLTLKDPGLPLDWVGEGVVAYQINDLNQAIVGHNRYYYYYTHVFVWDEADNSYFSLVEFDQPYGFGPYIGPENFGLSNNGSVAFGEDQIINIFDSNRELSVYDTNIDLAGADVRVRDMNDQGEIIGSTFYFNGREAVVLHGLDANTTREAESMNNAGQIVGYSQSNIGKRAIYWYDGAVVDLNRRIDSTDNWVLTHAYDINTEGRIVGEGTLNGQPRGFMLIPIVDDADQDGLNDDFENYIAGDNTSVDAATSNQDTDSLLDSEEIALGTNPFVADTDGDLIPDDAEVAYGLLPDYDDGMDDHDGDRFPNLFEHFNGSNPMVFDNVSAITPDFIVDQQVGSIDPQDNIYTTIQEAINAARDATPALSAAIVCINSGTYVGAGNTNFIVPNDAPPILLMGKAGAARTVIDGQLATSASLQIDALTAVSGLTIRNMSGAFSLYVNSNADRSRILDCVLHDNQSALATIYADSADNIVINSSTVYNNQVSFGAANGLYAVNSNVKLENSIFWNDGGGLTEFNIDVDSKVIALHCLIRGNELEHTSEVISPVSANLDWTGRLLVGSKARGAGKRFYSSLIDMDGEMRPQEGMSIGADQWVDVDGNDYADSWENIVLSDSTYDGDADGIFDYLELEYGLNPFYQGLDGILEADLDYDRDGVSNLDEMTHATNPTNPFSPPLYDAVPLQLPSTDYIEIVVTDANNSGQSVGFAFDSVASEWQPVYWDVDGNPTVIAFDASANAFFSDNRYAPPELIRINDSGLVAGIVLGQVELFPGYFTIGDRKIFRWNVGDSLATVGGVLISGYYYDYGSRFFLNENGYAVFHSRNRSDAYLSNVAGDLSHTSFSLPNNVNRASGIGGDSGNTPLFEGSNSIGFYYDTSLNTTYTIATKYPMYMYDFPWVFGDGVPYSSPRQAMVENLTTDETITIKPEGKDASEMFDFTLGGLVVGTAYNNTNSYSGNFFGRVDTVAFAWGFESQVIQLLPGLEPEHQTEARHANDMLEIAGTSEQTPIIWRNGIPYELGDCLTAESNVYVENILELADNGMIVVESDVGSFLLKPVADTDGDRMPDAWELANNLDPLFADDAAMLNDGDTLTNVEEYQNGTSPNDEDTDGDQMSDDWELAYQYNPTDPSDASTDYDEDGLTAVQEFFNGTLPNPQYDIVNLGQIDDILEGTREVHGFDINDLNEIVGYIEFNKIGIEPVEWEDDESDSYEQRAFYWNDSDGFILLNLNSNMAYSQALELNELGAVVGRVSIPSYDDGSIEDYDEGGAYWKPTSSRPFTSFDLTSLSNIYTTPQSVNDVGVLGSFASSFVRYDSSAGGYLNDAVIYDVDAGVSAGGQTDPDAYDRYAVVSAPVLNNSGTAAYYHKDNSTGEYDLKVWSGATVDTYPLISGFPVSGGAIYPRAINSSGSVVGDYGDQRGSFIFDGVGTFTDIGSLGAARSIGTAYDLNDSGLIVGQSYTPSGSLSGYLYKDNFTFDLNGLIPANSGWQITVARGINNNGFIVGTGLLNGVPRAFMLQPASNSNDGDLLPDDWELYYFGDLTTSDGSQNTDGTDGNDYDEYIAGTDPTNYIPTVSSLHLPVAQVGQDYDAPLYSSSGNPGFNWALSSGTPIPDGLNFDSNGSVYGIPTTAGQYELSVLVADADGGIDINTIHLTIVPAADVIIGEAGNYSVQQDAPEQWYSVATNRAYNNPIVITSLISEGDTDPATIRVRNVTNTGFEFQIDEWEYQDGIHGKETVSYLVVERGVYTLQDGRVLQAGTSQVDFNSSNINYAQSFATQPVVFGQVVTTNDVAAVTQRISAVTTSNFAVYLQGDENDPQDHALETMHWIAMTAGTGSNAYGLAEAGNTPNSVTHAWYSLNFGQTYSYSSVPLIVGMQTVDGVDPSVVRARNVTTTGASIQIDEEASLDSETDHATEVVGYFVSDAGVLLSNTLNHNPLITDFGSVSVTISEDNTPIPFDLILQGTDLDDDTLTWSISTPASNGVASILEDDDTGTEMPILYSPNLDYVGSDSFVVQVVDGNGGTDTLTVNVTVEAQPDAPRLGADNYLVDEDNVLNVTVPGFLSNDSEVDGDSFTAVTLKEDVSNGALVFNSNGSFNYTPLLNFYGIDSFIYEVEESTGLVSEQTVTINVAAIDDLPTGNADSYILLENTINFTVPAPGVLANDVDVEGDTMSVVLVQTTGNGTLNLASDGSFVYTPNAGFDGTDTFTYRASTPGGDSAITTATLNVVDAAYRPVAINDAFNLDEDAILLEEAPGVLANDISTYQPENLVAVLVSGTSNGTLSLNGDGSFNYSPNSNFAGTDTFTYRVDDGLAQSLVATVTITVNAINDLPVVTAAPSANPNPVRLPQTANLSIDAIDVEGDPLTYTWTELTGVGTLQYSSNGASASKNTVVTFEEAGVYEFEVTISDGTDSTVSEVLTLQVLDQFDRVVYVDKDATGNNNGTSWQNAYTSLVTALNNGILGDSIWVAEGTYYPGTAGNRAASFVMPQQVAIYGGFSGTETSLNERDVEVNQVILSGDIDGNDNTSFAVNHPSRNNLNNAYHVVIASDNSLLDGLYITGGRASGGSGNQNFGGGVYAPQLIRFEIIACSIYENYADYGGGISFGDNSSSSLNTSRSKLIEKSNISDNYSQNDGGGIYNRSLDPLVLRESIVASNTSVAEGGGFYNHGGDLMVEDSVFELNSSQGQGAGVYCDNLSFINYGQTARYLQTVFKSNTATGDGGGIYQRKMQGFIINCIFDSNAASSGGGLFDNEANSAVVSSVFYKNTANSLYGGGFLSRRSSTQFDNCTFVENSAALFGGAGCVGVDSDVTPRSDVEVRNSILWENTAPGASGLANTMVVYNNNNQASLNVNYGLSEDAGYAVAGTDSITRTNMYLDFNPQFINQSTVAGSDGVYFSADDGLTLQSSSQAVNNGSNAILPLDSEDIDGDDDTAEPMPFDITLRTRISDTTVDLGAYEFINSSGFIYVDANAPAGGDGSSWGNAFRDLQTALSIAISGDEIWVAAGTYKPSSSGDRNATFILKDGVALYGGFAGTETAITQRSIDITVNPTIISGDLNGDDDWGQPISDPVLRRSTDNSTRILFANGITTLDRFTIEGGNADDSAGGKKDGGALMAFGAQMSVYDCTFRHNRSIDFGGAVTNNAASGIYQNCRFENNLAAYGGGVTNFYPDINSVLRYEGCVFESNESTVYGGAVINWQGANVDFVHCDFLNNRSVRGGAVSGVFSDMSAYVNCLFASNYAQATGGAIYNGHESYPLVVGSVFYDNQAQVQGGAVINFSASMEVVHATFANNESLDAGSVGGAIVNGLDVNTYPNFSSELLIKNSLFYGNLSDGVSYDIYTRNDYTGLTCNTEMTNVGLDYFAYAGIPITFIGDNYYIASDPFINRDDLDGADDTLRTSDDGLVLKEDSDSFLNAADPSLIPQDVWDVDNDSNLIEILPLSLTSDARSISSGPDYGAYERATVPNILPIGLPDSYEVDEDTLLSVDAPGVLRNDDDPDGTLITAVLVTDVSTGSLNLQSDGSFTYQPDSNFFGNDSFTYRAFDGTGNSADTTVDITVNAVDDLPTQTTIPNVVLSSGTPQQNIDLSSYFSDVDDTLAYSFDNLSSALLNVSLNGTILTIGYNAPLSGVGTVLAKATGGGAVISEFIQVTVQPVSGQLDVVSSTPGQSSIVPLPPFGDSLDVVVELRNVVTDRNSVVVRDRFGNDISTNVALSASGVLLVVDPLDGLDSSQVGVGLRDGNETSEYLSGITHSYEIITNAGTAQEQRHSVTFIVDTEYPQVVLSHEPGRYAESSIGPITLTSTAPDLAAIYYSVDGSSAVPTTQYSAALTLIQNTVLQYYSVDTAGNESPVMTAFYMVEDLPQRPSLDGVDFTVSFDSVVIDWPDVAGMNYHVYKAFSTRDRLALDASIQGNYPPPAYLRVTDNALTISEYTDPESDYFGVTAYFVVTSVNGSGVESAPSSFVKANLSGGGSVANVDAAIARAQNWLAAKQNIRGSWGKGSNYELLTATQFLDATRETQVAAINMDTRRAALRHLRKRNGKDVQAIARSLEMLSIYGEASPAKTSLLRFHQQLETDADGENPTELGWGASYRFSSDPLHTAYGYTALRLADELAVTDQARELLDGQVVAIGSGATQVAIDGNYMKALDGDYGMTASGKRSIAATAGVIDALGKHRYGDQTDYQWILDLQDTDTGSPTYGSFGSVPDTANVLLHLPMTNGLNRQAARDYLVGQQSVDGHWNNDPLLTALCLDALAPVKVLYIYSGSSNNHDTEMQAMLEDRGYAVTLRDDDLVTLPTDLDEYRFIILSASISNLANVTSLYQDVAKTVLVNEPDLLVGLGLADNIASFVAQPSIDVALQHRQTDNLSPGAITIQSATDIQGANVNGEATVLANIAGDGTRAVYYFYETGDLLNDGSLASARRLVMTFNTSADLLNTDGKDLIDAAFEWGSERKEIR